MKSNFFKKAGSAVIAAALIFNTSAFSSFVSAEETKYEFENGTITGTSTSVSTDDSGYSGDGYVYLKEAGDTISIDISVPETGMYDLILNYYIPAADGNKIQYISINGVKQGEIAFSANAGFAETNFGAYKFEAGTNTLTIESFWGWTRLDYAKVETAELPTLMASKELCDEQASPEAKSLMNYLVDTYGNNIISGQQEFYGTSRDDEFNYIYNLCGDYPAIRGFDFGETCPLYAWNAGTAERAIEWVNEKGGIATASWHINVPQTMADYTLGSPMPFEQTTYTNSTDFVTANVMKEGTVEHDFFLLAVDNLAKELQKLEDANVPLLWRPFHEAEGNGGINGEGAWFWWSKEGAEVYKELYIYLYNLLTVEYDLHNLIWEFNSYVYDNSYAWYPGEDYVDIVGYDKYNATNYSTGVVSPNESSISGIFYNLVEMYSQHGNPIAMMENDTVPSLEALTSEKAGWLYFLPWYAEHLMDSRFNNPDTLAEVYKSDYCITLSELPDDLYSQEVTDDPNPVVTTTTDPNAPVVTTTTTTVPTFETVKVPVDFSARGDSNSIFLSLEGTPNAYTNGCVGYSVDGEWVSIGWETTLGADGKAVVEIDITDVPAEATSGEAQIWWASTPDEKLAENNVTAYSFTASSEPDEPDEPVVGKTGFYVDGTTIRDVNGNEFIMRGVNLAHAWYKDYTETSIKAVAELGTNCVRVVCADGGQWTKTTENEIRNIIQWCKDNKQICILEVHDATGSNNTEDIIKAAEYWAEMADILNENTNYVILNIANEWYGEWNSTGWAEGCKQAIAVVRNAGIKNMIMIDSAGWGQYPASIKEMGKEVFNSDPDKNTVFSIHMYEYAGGTAQMIKENIDGALTAGVPVVVGEFGIKHTDGDVDEAYIMEYCTQNNIGYIGWSWKGNSSGLEYLDLSNDWEGTSLTEWGEILFNQANGIAETANICSVYEAAPPTELLYGDANDDGSVDVSDAVFILQAIADPSNTEFTRTEDGELQADCKNVGNGVDAEDALAILEYKASKIDSLPA